MQQLCIEPAQYHSSAGALNLTVMLYIKKNFIKTYHKFAAILKEYCLNCSVAGVGYIANSKYHFTERIFWLICVALSSIGSYHLIEDYIEDFERQAVSLVIEDLRPQEKSIFPTIGICEEFNMLVNAPAASKTFARIIEEENIESLDSQDIEAVEDFLMTFAFPATLNKGTINAKCYSDEKIHYCPKKNFTRFMREIPASCPELFKKCKWNQNEFNCCDYFYKIQTTMGICYLLNSIQTKSNSKKNKLNLEVGLDLDDALLELQLNRAHYAYLLNEEDVPESALSFLKFSIRHPTVLKLSIANIINDDGVRDVDPDFRKCRFPDENFSDAIYKYYSFTACVSHCFKRLQLLLCNCAAYQYIAEDDTSTPSCNLEGLNCLDDNDLLLTTPKRLQPWNEKPANCTCLPSCTENEILMIENTQLSGNSKKFDLNISLINLPYERYRRQAVRGKLDIVVSIGGILGLFMGASILSGIELIYYLITGFYYHFIKNTDSKI